MIEDVNRREWILLAIILLLAAVLRLAFLNGMEFKGDEAFNLMKARQLARLQSIPLTSATSSTGIPEPPIFMYLLSIPTAISDHPVFVTGSVALLNALAVVPLFLLAKRHIAPIAAPLAAAFYAVNPWQIVYSRKIWTQNLLPFFTLLFLLLLFEGTFRRRRWLVSGALALLGITVQLHLSAGFLVPFVIFFLLWQRRHLEAEEILVGCFAALLTFIPYLVFVIQHSQEIANSLAEIGRQPFIPRMTGILYPLQLVTTDGLDHVTLLFRSYPEFRNGLIDLTAVDLLARAVLVVGVGTAFWRGDRAARTLAGYAILAVGYVMVGNRQIFPHYYNALLPVLFILASIPLAALISQAKPALTGLTAPVFLGLIGAQLYFSASLLQFLSQKDCILGGYGPPYRQQVLAIEEALAEADPAEALAPESLHERVSSCPNWDPMATEYIYDLLTSQPGVER